MKQLKMSECPRCNSKMTGEIMVQSSSVKSDIKTEIRMMNRGRLARFVSPDDYRNYYRPFGINAFCSECGHEFAGELERVNLSFDDIDKYREEHGIKIPEEIGFLKKISIKYNINPPKMLRKKQGGDVQKSENERKRKDKRI